AGGDSRLRTQVIADARHAENPDLGMTAFWLLGLRDPRDRNGRPIPERLRGRVLSEAFAQR
ncbi:MAG: hypothetical protein ACREQ9_03635, partial [Candidatus Binatia bacterium]